MNVINNILFSDYQNKIFTNNKKNFFIAYMNKTKGLKEILKEQIKKIIFFLVIKIIHKNLITIVSYIQAIQIYFLCTS